MSLFIDKHNRRKSPIALAAFGAALLDLVVFGGLYALLSEPLYRAVSLGSETATTVVHALLIALAGTAVCCLLFFLPDKRVAPYGFAGLAVVLAMFYVAAAAMSAPAQSAPSKTRSLGLMMSLQARRPRGYRGWKPIRAAL